MPRTMKNLHRNNAAEWAMLVLIAPVVGFMKLFKRSEKKEAGHGAV